METLLIIIGSLLGIIALMKWSSRGSNTNINARNIGSTPRQLPPPLPSNTSSNSSSSRQVNEQVSNAGIKHPPALPIRKNKNSSLRIYDYPKCPIDRRRNVVGKPQQIYWSSQRECYHCNNGHYFTGKEH